MQLRLVAADQCPQSPVGTSKPDASEGSALSGHELETFGDRVGRCGTARFVLPTDDVKMWHPIWWDRLPEPIWNPSNEVAGLTGGVFLLPDNSPRINR